MTEGQYVVSCPVGILAAWSGAVGQIAIPYALHHFCYRPELHS